jgi:hypothetical protein
LNGFVETKEKLIDAKAILKQYPTIYLSFKEEMSSEKMKYDTKGVKVKDRTSFNKLSIVLIINIDKVIMCSSLKIYVL